MLGGRACDVVSEDSLAACSLLVRRPMHEYSSLIAPISLCRFRLIGCLFSLVLLLYWEESVASGRASERGKAKQWGRGRYDGADALTEHPRESAHVLAASC